MDNDLDEGIKNFQMSVEENEKVLLYIHVNGSSRLVLGRKALYFSSFWFSEYAVLCFSPRPHRLRWRNLKTQLIFTVRPTFDTKNGAFRKRSSNRWNLETSPLLLCVDVKHFKNRALRKHKSNDR